MLGSTAMASLKARLNLRSSPVLAILSIVSLTTVTASRARSTATARGVKPTPPRSAKLLGFGGARGLIRDDGLRPFADRESSQREFCQLPKTCAAASTAPAKLAYSAGAAVVHLPGANVAVAQVRGPLGRQRILVFERRETVLGKHRHPGVVSGFLPDLVEPGGVAAEDQLLGGAIGVAERRKPAFLLHVLRNFEAAQRLDLPLR